MQQTYRYGDPHTAFPEAGVDGSRVIALFIFNTDVHMHAYPADGLDGRGARTASAATREFYRSPWQLSRKEHYN